MSTSNDAAVLYGIDDLRFESFPLNNTVAPGHVRVAIKAVGICGSDVHYLKKGHIGDFVVKSPMVIGHESAGVIKEVGAGVTHLRVGDPVALEPGVPCWACKASREGRYNLDPSIQFFATPPVHGSLARFVDHPEDFCWKLPQGVTLEEGAFCEPLSVGVHACRRAGVQPGKTVVILGAGPIGMVTLLCAKAFGADAIAVTDIKESNLQLVESYGATPVQVSLREPPQEISSRLKGALAAASGVDVVIDCAGFQQTLDTAMDVVTPGGKIVLVGMGQEHLKLPAHVLTCKEIDLCGSFRYANTYPLCINLLHSKRVDVHPLITHRFGFNAKDVAAGFDTAARADVTNAIKVMFNLD
eukprot:jgi/Chrzof1/9445/Cz04g03110.t1